MQEILSEVEEKIKDIGKRMREAQQSCGYSVSQIAENCQVSHFTIYNAYLSRHQPTLKTLAVLSRMTNIPVDVFIFGD